ncbi:MAG: DUF4262 domain-containing protein [Propionicimonas sp.]
MIEPTSPAQISAWNDQEDRRVTEIIRRHGCFIQAVAGERRTPPFAYSVGLFGLGHPELIVFGMDLVSAGGTLNWFFDRIRAGEDLIPGEIVEPPRSGMRFLVEIFPEPGAALYAANRHYQRPREASVPAYQLTWDVNGAFPWEPGYPYPAWLQPRPGGHVE